MKKLMCVLALAGLMVGCAKDQNTGASSDQNQMNTGANSSAPANTNVNNGSTGTQQ